jgi:glycosyltransferase involved in cell wall biosynthesis
MSKVTVIITTFNRAAFLAQAIDSVLNQTINDFELIILDNNSSDKTFEVIQRYSDSRIKYVRHDNIGISSQRNMGLSMANSKYVAFLDDDDVWLNKKIEFQLSAMERSCKNTALVYGGFRFYDDYGRRWGEHLPTLVGKVLDGLLWTKDPFCGSASNPLINKECAVAVGAYSDRVQVGEDWELYLRLAERYPIVGVDEVLLEIRQHSGPRLGQRIDAALSTDRHVYRLFRKHMSKKLASRYLQKIGGKYIRLGSRLKGRKLIIAALVTHPFNLMAWVQLGLSIFDDSIYRKFHKVYHRYMRSF